MTPPPPPFRDPRLTEQRNRRTERSDLASSLEIVGLISAEDQGVPTAVRREREAIALAIDLVVGAFRTGGRLVYVGAGTSGRLGVLDASECPPTFGTPPELVVGIIAGGPKALMRSAEGVEDDVNAGAEAMDAARVGANDVVVGIAASGTTPFVRSALARAQTLGAKTALVSCSDPPAQLAATCDVVILPKVGPEVLTGSTRMKAGTATKLVLNSITTGAMIRLGKVDGNLMDDLMATSDKLRDRGQRIETIARGGAKELGILHVALAERFAGAVLQLLAKAKVSPASLAFIASHGQTVWHEPGRASLQLGDPAVLAERLGVRVVSDFRARDG